MMGNLTSGQQHLVDQQAKLIMSGHADPTMQDLSGRAGMAALKPYITQKMQEIDPEFNSLNASGDRKYWNSASTRKQLQVMNVVSEQLPILKAASDQMKRSGLPVLDKATIKTLEATGNVDASNYVAASTASVEDIGKAIAGGNAMTNDQLRLADRLLPLGATPAQLDKIIQQLENGVNSRKLTVYQQGGVYGRFAAKNDPFLNEETKNKILTGNYVPGAGGGQAASVKMKDGTVVKPGDTYKGHVFNGGDPTQPSSWGK